MKKTLLLLLAISLGAVIMAQNLKLEKMPQQAPKQEKVYNLVEKQSPITSSAFEQKPSQTYFVNGRELEFINIGSAGNAYGFYGSPRSYLWADNNINSVVFTHRMVVDPPGSYGNSRIAYATSWEGGAQGTWHLGNQVYEPTGPGSPYPENAGRYPQGAIINPVGNTDPNEAIYTYFISVIANENDIWGGYAYGINFLTNINPTNPTQHIDNDPPPPYRLIPDDFIVTQQGVAWMIDQSYDIPGSQYTGEYIFYRGEMNETNDDIEYDWWTMDILEPGDIIINDSKVAFDPTGQYGYFCVMSDSPSDPAPYTNYHPILYETVDGGETWNEDPIHCQLGGPDGIDSVKYYLSDEILDAIYGAGSWDRETVPYNMGFHTGFHVDYAGNAHCLGIIAPGSDDGWYPNPDVMGTFHLWYDRQSETWDAKLLYMNHTFDGDMGGIPMYNRPYISSDMDGRHLFFSWIDTDQEGVEENVSPDIYLVTYDIINHEYSEVMNVTSFTQAMWTAYWGSQSHYVFTEIVGNDLYCDVPFVYEEVDPNDPAAEVTFWYIHGYQHIFYGPWEVNDPYQKEVFDVSQNFPNPFSTETQIDVNLKNKTNLSLEVYNLTGQKMLEINKGAVNAGKHQFNIDAKDLSKGVYFYTVKTDHSTQTKKMILE